MSMLQNLNTKKISSIVIVGPYRTGKSFIANRFLGKMKGFEIGSSVQSCTKGIWIWNQPINISDDTEALLLDTEGLYATDQHFDIDQKIFMLSVLLSSVFIFNQRSHITEQSLEDLSLTLNLSKMMIADENDAGG